MVRVTSINLFALMKRSILIPCYLLVSFSLFAQKVHKEDSDDEGGKPPMVMPVLIRGPYLQCASPVSMMIRWRTDVSARSRVRYGSTPEALTAVADDSLLVTEHKVLLTGLVPGTRYYYSVGGFKDTLAAGGEDYFYTLPVSGSAATVHNAMYFSDDEHGGASMLEVTGDRLVFKWICSDGVVRDRFTMLRKAGN